MEAVSILKQSRTDDCVWEFGGVGGRGRRRRAGANGCGREGVGAHYHKPAIRESTSPAIWLQISRVAGVVLPVVEAPGLGASWAASSHVWSLWCLP